ncbi:MAG: hypothetical protein QM756_46935 [Polyangiaceae bacterium]
MTIPDEIRNQARRSSPPDTAKLRFSKLKELEQGLVNTAPELKPLQEWAVKALSSRKAMLAPLGEKALEKLQALMVMPAPQGNPWGLCALLVEAHGLEPVFEALLTKQTLGTRSIGGDKLCLVHQHEGEGRDYAPWVNALTTYFDAAPQSTRDRFRQLTDASRAHLALSTRVALNDLFCESTWAEADARCLLAMKPKAHAVARQVSYLLPLVEADDTFEALAQLSSSNLDRSIYASIAVLTPAERALPRLLRLLRDQLTGKDNWQVRQIAAALVCFSDATAAAAVTEVALFAREEAKAYFRSYPEHRPLLDAQTKGRGKRPREFQALIAEMERQSVASQATPDGVALPNTLAKPPWLERESPWPSRDLALVTDGEYVIASAELAAWRGKDKCKLSQVENLGESQERADRRC